MSSKFQVPPAKRMREREKIFQKKVFVGKEL
jgi:hypothetical protein